MGIALMIGMLVTPYAEESFGPLDGRKPNLLLGKVVG